VATGPASGGQALPRAVDNFRIQLTRPGAPQNNVSAQVHADGRFTLEQVVAGEWLMTVTPAPLGFVKAAKYGSHDVRFSTFEVGETAAPLDILVSTHTATVEGQVDAASAQSKRAGIVIAPVGAYHTLLRFYYGGAADDEGKFKVTGIAPGAYKVFALEKMAAATFRNPEAVDQIDELGERVDIGEGATVQAHPKLVPAERAAKALP
jgi:hypothetical protein